MEIHTTRREAALLRLSATLSVSEKLSYPGSSPTDKNASAGRSPVNDPAGEWFWLLGGGGCADPNNPPKGEVPREFGPAS